MKELAFYVIYQSYFFFISTMSLSNAYNVCLVFIIVQLIVLNTVSYAVKSVNKEMFIVTVPNSNILN